MYLKILSYCIPQGSVLGPILFSINMLPSIEICHHFHEINYHLYADDLQMYMELLYSSFCYYYLLNYLNTLNNWFI